MKFIARNMVIPLIAFVVSSGISLWILAALDEYWSYPAEFGFSGLVLRCVLPALIGLGIVMTSPAWRKKPVFLFVFTLAMIAWLYLPVLVVVLGTVCLLTGDCL